MNNRLTDLVRWSDLGVKLRRAEDTSADSLVFFDARNDPTSRIFSRNTGPLDGEMHRLWYAQSLKDKRNHLFVIEEDGTSAGYVRYAEPDNEVSIALLPSHRGRGLGAASIRLLAAQHGSGPLRGVIRRDNLRSIKLFKDAGFRLVGEVGDWQSWEWPPVRRGHHVGT
jgi:RimJ/RimL family protein N-acetyltransferase